MILLRDFTDTDADRLVEILNDDAVTRFLSTKIPNPYTLDDAHWWIQTGSRSNLVKAISVDGVLAGCIGVNRGDFEYQRSGEIGYWLAREYWRKGIALHAVSQMTNEVFDNTDIVRVFAAVFCGNEASMGLLSKAGFEQEAVLKNAIFKYGQFHDNHIFAKLRP